MFVEASVQMSEGFNEKVLDVDCTRKVSISLPLVKGFLERIEVMV